MIDGLLAPGFVIDVPSGMSGVNENPTPKKPLFHTDAYGKWFKD